MYMDNVYVDKCETKCKTNTQEVDMDEWMWMDELSH